MKLSAVLATLLVGYLGYTFLPGTGFSSIFSIATMGYFILKSLEKIDKKERD